MAFQNFTRKRSANGRNEHSGLPCDPKALNWNASVLPGVGARISSESQQHAANESTLGLSRPGDGRNGRNVVFAIDSSAVPAESRQ